MGKQTSTAEKNESRARVPFLSMRNLAAPYQVTRPAANYSGPIRSQSIYICISLQQADLCVRVFVCVCKCARLLVLILLHKYYTYDMNEGGYSNSRKEILLQLSACVSAAGAALWAHLFVQHGIRVCVVAVLFGFLLLITRARRHQASMPSNY